MPTQKIGLHRTFFLMIAAAAVFLPQSATAASRTMSEGLRTDPGAYQTVIVVDDHCPLHVHCYL